MKKLTIIFILALLFTAGFAFNKSDFYLDTSKGNNGVVTDWGYGCQYYVVSGKNLDFDTSINLPSISALGKSSIKSGYWEILNEGVEHERDIWSPNVKCKTETASCTVLPSSYSYLCNNGTYTFENCTDEGKYVKEKYYTDDWAKYSSYTFKSKRDTEIRYCANYDMNALVKGWGVSVDIIPSFAGNYYPEYAWFNATWLYRAPCYVNTTVTSSLSNFPAHCIIDTQTPIAAGKMNTSCQDLRAANASGGLLSYEIENSTCNTTATVVWVKIPATTASANDTVYVYYGGGAVADGQNVAGVWTNYKFVSHMAQNNGVGSIGLNATVTGSTTNSTGKFGNAQTFNGGTGNGWNISNTIYADAIGNNFMVSVWIKNSNSNYPASGTKYFIGTQNAGNTQFFKGGFETTATTGHSGPDRVTVEAVGATGTSSVGSVNNKNVSDGNFHLIQIYINSSGTLISQYTDGLLNNSNTFSANHSTAKPFGIGHQIGGTDEASNDWNGTIDEFRLSNATVYTANYFAAEYAQTDYIGAEENVGGSYLNAILYAPINKTYFDSNNQTISAACVGANSSYLLNITLNGTAILNSQPVTNATAYSYSQNFTNDNWEINATCWNGTYINTSGSAYFTISVPSWTIPTPLNGTDNYTYINSVVFNFTTFSAMTGNGSIEVDGVNKTCSISSDGLSCNYTMSMKTAAVSPSYGNTYDLRGFANYSGAYYLTNETRTFNYYGCGYVFTNVTLSQNLNFTALSTESCFTINSSNVAFNCSRFAVNITSGALFYSSNKNNITITSCTLIGGNSNTLIDFSGGGNYAYIYNNTFIGSDNTQGIMFRGSYYEIYNNTFQITQGNVVRCTSSPSNTSIYSNTFMNGSRMLECDTVGANFTVWNNIFGTSGSGLNAPANMNNTYTTSVNILGGSHIGGNAWYGTTTNSKYYGKDFNNDGIGDSPFNWSVGEYDYLPLTLDNTGVVYFVSPSPVNNTNNFTYGMIFNFTVNDGNATLSSNSYIELDGANKTCTLSSNNLSCAYTLTAAEHIFNHTYSVRGFANFSSSGATSKTNETRSVPYYGCGNFTAPGTLQGNVSINGFTCFTANAGADGLIFDGNGYTVTGNLTSGTYGIDIAVNTQDYTWFRNFTITNFETGIRNEYRNNNFTNMVSYNNSLYGIHMVSPSAGAINITNCSFYNNSIGANISTVAFVTNYMGNVMAYNNTGDGIDPPAGWTFVNVTAYNNGGDGIEILGSTINGAHIYNNTARIKASTLASQVYNLILDDPTGSYLNYTNVTFNVSSATNGFLLAWDNHQPAPPVSYFSFSNKSINYTYDTTSATVTAIEFNWLDSELVSYNESKFSLFEYVSGSWTELNDTPDTTNNKLSYYPSAAYTESRTFSLMELNFSASFAPPTLANNSNTSSDFNLNMSATSMLSGCYYQIDGTNYTATMSSDNLSCSYTYSPSNHSHPYSIIGWANNSGAWAQATNGTLVLNWYNSTQCANLTNVYDIVGNGTYMELGDTWMGVNGTLRINNTCPANISLFYILSDGYADASGTATYNVTLNASQQLNFTQYPYLIPITFTDIGSLSGSYPFLYSALSNHIYNLTTTYTRNVTSPNIELPLLGIARMLYVCTNSQCNQSNSSSWSAVAITESTVIQSYGGSLYGFTSYIESFTAASGSGGGGSSGGGITTSPPSNATQNVSITQAAVSSPQISTQSKIAPIALIFVIFGSGLLLFLIWRRRRQ